MKVKTKRRLILASAILAVLILISLVLGLSYMLISTRSDYKRMESNLSKSEKSLSIVMAKSGQLMGVNSALILTTTELKNTNSRLIDSLKNMGIKVKNLDSYVEAQTRVIDSLKIGFTKYDTVLITVNGVKVDTLKFSKGDKYFKVDGLIHNTGVNLNYEVNSYYKYAIDFRRPSLFKAKEPIVTLLPENPKERVVELVAIKVTNGKPRWYETRLFAFLAGVGVGSASLFILK